MVAKPPSYVQVRPSLVALPANLHSSAISNRIAANENTITPPKRLK